MTLTDILSTLSGLLSCSSPTAVSIAQQATDLSQQLQAGTISQDEYKELIADLQTEQLINVEASALAEKQVLAGLFSQILAAAAIVLP